MLLTVCDMVSHLYVNATASGTDKDPAAYA